MLDTAPFLAAFDRGRERSRLLFSIPREEAYYTRPIRLRNPIVFYEGHIPAFAINVLFKLALNRPGIDDRLERLFARGIDPESEAAVPNHESLWPTRDQVKSYVAAAEHALRETIADPGKPSGPCWEHDEALHTVVEHELMHQETLLYMFHCLSPEMKQRVEQEAPPPSVRVSDERIVIPRGVATLGADRNRFGWDNEFCRVEVDVPRFAIDRSSVTNAAYLEFVDAGGYDDSRWWSEAGWNWRRETGISHPQFWGRDESGSWTWNGMFETFPLPLDWPVYATLHEAEAYARWRGGRLPTEAEYHRAAYATPEGKDRTFPWGEEPPDRTRGNFGFRRWDPVPAGSYPAGASAWGVDDLVGNGWEWTASLFAPFDGFRPMATYGEYSVDFFDGAHYVLKGASPATGERLIRRTFRNWFRPNYPYVYAKFRCVWS